MGEIQTHSAPHGPDGICRCFWANDTDLMRAYHDQEWGEPIRDDQLLFRKLILDGFQAGLSWRTILHKRENFVRVFDGFDPAIIAGYDEDKIQALLADAGIVRNRLKIRGAVRNAQAYLQLVIQVGSFGEWLWAFVGGDPKLPHVPRTRENMPTFTPEAEAMSKALRRANFTFVGPTICYAFMQASGMVNDHVAGCFKYQGP